MTDVLSSQAIGKGKISSKRGPVIGRTRKALSVLQVLASDENLLVATPGMMRKVEKKALEPSGDTLKNSSKEYLPRRSKRKNAVSQNEVKEKCTEDNQSFSKSIKLKLPKVSKVKKTSKAKTTKELVQSNQSNLDSYVSVASKSNEISVPIKKEIVDETYICKNDTEDTVLDGEATMRVVNSTSDEAEMLTSSVPNITYWKMLAEQRQCALEMTLYENAQLKDEIEVLETDNSQLRHTLQELEKVVEIINASLE